MLDISQLPEPSFVEEISFEVIFSRRKAQFIAEYSPEKQQEVAATLTLESDPVVKLLQEAAYNEMILRARINRAALDTTLAFGGGDNLDVTAANNNTERRLISPADPNANPPRPAEWESDDSLRERAQLAFEKISTAGHGAGYYAHAKDAHPLIEDVSVFSPSPAVVNIYFLRRDGDGDDDAAIATAILKKLNGWETRPIADRVYVYSAERIDYQITAALYLYQVPESEPVIQAAIARAQQFVVKFRRLGRDIPLTAIAAALHVDGVQRVDIQLPAADLVIAPHQVAINTGLHISFGGYDD